MLPYRPCGALPPKGEASIPPHQSLRDSFPFLRGSHERQPAPKAPLCKGRDALSKHAGGMFAAKAGSKLRLRPGGGRIAAGGIVFSVGALHEAPAFCVLTTCVVSIFSLLVQRESGQKEKARQRGEEFAIFPPQVSFSFPLSLGQARERGTFSSS